MANTAITKSRHEQTPPHLARGLEPLRVFRDLIRWSSLVDPGPALSRNEPEFAPSFEVRETNSGFVFKADLPGVRESDLDVRVSTNRLTVSGKRESESSQQDDTYYAYECAYGSFSRTFTLPEGVDVDHATSRLEHGVLTVELPRLPGQGPRKLPVKTL